MAQQWLSIVEYARAFSISDMTVRRRIKTGKLDSVMRDGKYYIPVDIGENGEYIRRTSSKSNTTVKVEERQPEVPKTAPRTSMEPAQYEVVHSRPQTSSEPIEKPKPKVEEPVVAPVRPATIQSVSQRQDPGIIDVCRKMLSKLNNTEELINSRYEAQINALHSDLRSKDIEIDQLRQQIEDLQVLVKILESN